MICAVIMLYMIMKTVKNAENGRCIVYSVSLWTLYLYFITEMLSVFHKVRFIPLLTAWIIFDIFLLFVLIYRRRKYNNMIESKQKSAKVICAVIYMLFCAFMLFLAYRIVPYNWDSMTYHLGRIVNWAQNGSVAHYAASVMRQVCSPVLAEFVNLNAYVLMKGNDCLFNCLQCVSYLINIILVYKIAEKIGCDRKAMLLASILFAASPSCFTEALSTQVDEFAALWLLLYVYLILEAVYDKEKFKLGRETYFRMFVIALTIAFGYLTKPTVILAMVIFAAWMVIRALRRNEDRKTVLTWVVTVPLSSMIVILPELVRNIITFHAISPERAGKAQMVGTLDPRYVFVGMLKNLFHNLPSVHWSWINEFAQDVVYWSAYHLGINADSEAISEGARPYVLQTPPDYSYDTSVNPVICALFFICIAVFVILRIYDWKKKRKHIVGYSTIAFLSFIVLCMTARWEPYVSRYMVPYLALLCPAIAMQIQKFYAKMKNCNGEYGRGIFTGLVYFMCMIDIIGLVSYHCGYILHDIDRNKGYFVYNDVEYEYGDEVAKIIKENGWKNIGMNLGCDSYEYPIWKILGNNGYTIKHVNVANETVVYEDQKFIPDCIIAVDTVVDGNVYECHGKEYHHFYKFSDDYVLIAP